MYAKYASVFKLIKAPKLLKGSKSFNALDESCNFMYVAEEKYLYATILAILFTFETVGGLIIHGNCINKTIIYKRILGKGDSLCLT